MEPRGIFNEQAGEGDFESRERRTLEVEVVWELCQISKDSW